LTAHESLAVYSVRMDRSNGYEAVSEDFLARRGNHRTRSIAIGVKEVRKWAKTLPHASSVIDLGCGPGFPITVVLVGEGLQVFGVDAAPSFVAAFQRNLPGTPIICESVLESRLFDRTFDAVLSIGLMFLLKAEEQHRLIQRFAEILVPGGRLLFTSTAKPAVWNDAMTGLESISLGADEYTKMLGAGLSNSSISSDTGKAALSLRTFTASCMDAPPIVSIPSVRFTVSIISSRCLARLMWLLVCAGRPGTAKRSASTRMSQCVSLVMFCFSRLPLHSTKQQRQ
jgi:SAM-dependent methyltransferase